MPVDEVEHGMHAELATVVAPLERAARQPLSGPNRALCQAALDECPLGFPICAERALRRARTSPLGLLVRMVRDGDHRLAQLVAEERLAEGASPDELGDMLDELRGRFALLIERDDGRIARETFVDAVTFERRAAELERDLGAHRVTREAA
jgi:hypothetical protein